MDQQLTDFLNSKDESYQWQVLDVASSDISGVTLVQLDLTSQQWREGVEAGVNHSIWQHRLTLYLPDQHSYLPCLMMLNGGTRHNLTLESTPASQVNAAKLCQLTGAPVATLKDIPNQPLAFSDNSSRAEDDLVAFSWKAFLDDPERNRLIPLQWPMVKSVIRAMDAITEYTSDTDCPVTDFVLAGASKRGWTAWLTAAFDQRVMALIPMVIDTLNVKACTHHHLNVYKGFADAIDDYANSDHNILDLLDTPEMQQLMDNIDPLFYKDQLFLPKIIINASADEFFPPDSARFYYHQLPGPCWLRYLPNSSHYLGREKTVNISQLMASAFGALISEADLPDMQWNMTEDGVEIRVNQEPLLARIWICHNPEKRDFRKNILVENDLCYQPVPLKTVGENPWFYSYSHPTPKSGWSAFFIELSFANGPYPDFVLTTGVRIIPDIY